MNDLLLAIDPWARFVLILAVTLLVSVIIRLISRIPFKNHRTKTVVRMAGSILIFVVWIAGILLALHKLGIDSTSLLVGTGILGIILGLGSESIIADIISGILLIADKDFQVGDIIALDDFRGEVISMGLRTVSIKDAGGSINVIRNSSIESVINLSKERSVAVVKVPVNYEESLEKVEMAIQEATKRVIEGYPDIFTATPVYRGVEEMDSENTMLLITADVTEGNIYQARRILLREIRLAYERYEVMPPYHDN